MSSNTSKKKYTTFVALGELTDKTLTKIRVIAERSMLDSSRLANDNAFDLTKLNDKATSSGMYSNNFTVYKADNPKDIANIKDNLPNKVKSFLNLLSPYALGPGKVILEHGKVNASNTNPYGGSKKTQRRRQKRQNRKSRRI